VKAESAVIEHVELVLNLCREDRLVARAARLPVPVTAVQFLGPPVRQQSDIELETNPVSDAHRSGPEALSLQHPDDYPPGRRDPKASTRDA